jgi:hypothetical protein
MQGFLLVAILGGLLIALRGAHRMALGRETAAWPTVPGWLVRAEIGNAIFGRGGRRIETVHYRYEVDGARFDGSLLSYRRFGSVQEAEAAVRQISQHKQVTVHYDPARPERAVLVPAVGPGATVDLLVGLALMTVGLGLWYVRG